MSTYKIDYGNAIVECGLFLRRLERPSTTTKEYREPRGRLFTHLSTFVDRSTIKEAILEIVQKAQKHVLFTSFLIQDDEVTRALITAAKRLSGHVYVLTTLKSQDFEAAYAEKSDGEDEGWSFQDHIRHIGELTANGIYVKARKDCHAKFVVVDDTYAIVTSANAAPTCYVNIDRPDGTQRPANAENGVLIRIPSEVARLGNFFRAIWRSGSNYYVSPDANLFDIGQYTDQSVTINCTEPREYDPQNKILWTAPEDARIREALLAMVGQAESSIRISSMFVNGVESHVLGEALFAATKRGVQVEIIVRRTRRSERLRSCYNLKKTMGVLLTIIGDYYNHSKAVLIDNNRSAIIMTANLDADHGLDHGVEVAFLSHDKRFTKSVFNFLNRLGTEAQLEFIADPTQSQAAKRWTGPKTKGLDKRLHLQVNPMWQSANADQQIKEFIAALGTELVHVRDDTQQGEAGLLLSTNTLVAHCQRHSSGQITVRRIENVDPTKTFTGLGSLLPQTTITITTS